MEIDVELLESKQTTKMDDEYVDPEEEAKFMLKKKPLKDSYRYVLNSVKNKEVVKEDGQYVRRSICGKTNDYRAKEAAKFLKMFKANMAKAFSSKVKHNRFNR